MFRKYARLRIGKEDISGLRIVFDVNHSIVMGTAFATVKVYGLSDDTPDL